ncbi:MAG: TonB-dependent receptor [Brevinematales bacterium]|nr:TonB-dependent receptor [Brevinematales bacterium]
MWKKFCILLCLSFIINTLWGANLKIIVKEKKKPIQDATVVLIEKKIQKNTEADGSAIFDNIENGRYTLVVVIAGYEKFSKEILVEDKDLEIPVELKRLKITMTEITVEEKREKGKVPASKKISNDELKIVSQGFMNDAIKVVQSMPGVGSSGNMFDASMYIQGGNWYENIALMEGVVLINPYKWGGKISMFNPNWVDSIELYTAGYPAYLAQGLSGALIVKIKEGNKERLKGYFDLSSATSEIGFDGPIGKNITFYFNVRRTYYELFAPLFTKTLEGTQFPHITDSIFKLTITPTIDDKISLFLYGSEEGMKWKFSGDENDASGTTYNGEFYYYMPQFIFGLRYDRRLTEKDSFDIVLGATYNKANGKFDGGPMGTSEWDSQMLNIQPLVNFYINSFDSHKIQTGGAIIIPVLLNYSQNIKYYSLDANGNWTNTFNYEAKLSNYTMPYYLGYVMDNWEFIKSFILEAGCRIEYYQPTGETVFNPVGGLKWEITEDTSIYVRGGRYNYFHFNVYEIDEKYGNPKLKSEKAYHCLVGTEYDKDEYLLRTEGFYKWYYDVVYSDKDKKFNNDGFREVYGGTLYLQKKKKKNDFWNGWITYTYVHGIEKVTNLGSPDPSFPSTIPIDEWFIPEYLREHTLCINFELINKLKFDNPWLDWLYDWSLSFDFKFMSGKPYTPITNFIEQDIPGVGKQYYYQYGKHNSEYTPLYHKLDLKISMPGGPFDFLKLFGLKFESSSYISFINIYNNENIIDYQYMVKNGELKKLAKKDFGFMVLGGFRIEF